MSVAAPGRVCAELTQHDTGVTWALITGEYPPQAGGVADYTRLLATALAERGERVHVFAPGPTATAEASADHPHVHRLRHGFSTRGLWDLDRAIRQLPQPRRLLLQYVPHAFGYRALNVPLAHWLAHRPDSDLWTMFHEVAFTRVPRQRLRHRLLARTHEYMASRVVRASTRTFVSTLAWSNLLRQLAPEAPSPTWLPVPSTVAIDVSAEETDATRRRLAGPSERPLVGHFGSGHPEILPIVHASILELAQRVRGVTAVIVGRDTATSSDGLRSRLQDLDCRLVELGDSSPHEVATTLASCDVLLQPYPDGVSSRRTSLMAGLGVGAAVVTAAGRSTEPRWTDSGAVRMAESPAPSDLADALAAMLQDADARRRLRRAASREYDTQFAMCRTVQRLLAAGSVAT